MLCNESSGIHHPCTVEQYRAYREGKADRHEQARSILKSLTKQNAGEREHHKDVAANAGCADKNRKRHYDEQQKNLARTRDVPGIGQEHCNE